MKKLLIIILFVPLLMRGQFLELMPEDYNYLPNSLYVTKNGNDANNGLTKATALLTIGAAYTKASTGQTIYVFSGTYSENFTGSYGFYMGKDIRWIGRGTVIWSKSGATGGTVLLQRDTESYYENIIFDGTSQANAVRTYSNSPNVTFVNCTAKNANYNWKIENADTNTFMNCKSQNGGTYEIYISGNAVNTFSNYIFQTSDALYGFYFNSATNTVIDNFSIDPNHIPTNLIYQTGSAGNHVEIKNCYLTLNDSLYSFYNCTETSSGTFTFKNNNVTILKGLHDPLLNNQASISNTTIIQNNTFNNEYALAKVVFINMSNKANILIDGNTFNSISTNILAHIALASTGVSCKANITNNIFQSRTPSGYVISIGTESTSANDNKLDGSIIESNTIYGAGYYDDTYSGIVHSIFIGHNENAKILRNKIYGGGYAVVYKHTSGMSDSGLVAYNLIVNANQAMRIKGCGGIDIYNNTIFFDKQICNYAFNITDNDGLGNGSINLDIKNNAFYSTNNINKTIRWITTDTPSYSSWSLDYNNVYFNNSGNKYYLTVNSTVYDSFSAYQALGWETHGLNIDPLFTSTIDYSLQAGSDLINTGSNIGLTSDILGNAIIGNPDIGAYEKQ